MAIVPTPSPGTAPWTTTGTAIIDKVNAIEGSFIDVFMNQGAGLSQQTITTATFTKLQLNQESTDTFGLFDNASTFLYTAPTTGIYFIQALVRCTDNPNTGTWTTAGGTNLGVGVHTSNIDGQWFQWNKVMPLNSGSGRNSFDYTRIASFNAADTLQLYVFHDAGSDRGITSASLQIFRIA